MESDKIENLLTSYFEGNTSLVEESVLMDYFNNQKVADHLVQYKPIFIGMSAARKEVSNRNFNLEGNTSSKTNNSWRYAVAAMVVIGMGVGGFYFSKPQMSQEEKEALMAFEKSKKAMMMLSENFNKGTSQISLVDQFTVAKEKFWKESSE